MNNRSESTNPTWKQAAALFRDCPQLVAPVAAILAAVISAPVVAFVASQIHA